MGHHIYIPIIFTIYYWAKNFKAEAKNLKEQIALLARTLASTFVDSHLIDLLITFRLIPLSKNLSVRLIGIGEVLRRVIGKTINWVLKDDMQEATGLLHTATGLKAGAEAAIHAMWTISENPSFGIILFHTSNTFNSLNGKVALNNFHIVFSHILINTYRTSSRTIIMVGAEIQSV